MNPTTRYPMRGAVASMECDIDRGLDLWRPNTTTTKSVCQPCWYSTASTRSTTAPCSGPPVALTRDVAAAEDLTQDAFLAALNNSGRIGGYDRPELWVRRVVTNRSVPRFVG